jgi:hypothetical protein
MFCEGRLGGVLVNYTYKCFILFYCNVKFYKFDADFINMYQDRNVSKLFKSTFSVSFLPSPFLTVSIGKEKISV